MSWCPVIPIGQIAEHVRKGIYQAGGAVAEFGVIGACDGLSNGHEGMYFSLPSRDLIAGSIEIMVKSHRVDGLAMIGSCNKIIPGMMMAAARLDIPAIIAVGGPMLGGIVFDNRKSDLTSLAEAFAMRARNKIRKSSLSSKHGHADLRLVLLLRNGQHDVLPVGGDGIVFAGLGDDTGGILRAPSISSAAGKAIVELTQANLRPGNHHAGRVAKRRQGPDGHWRIDKRRAASDCACGRIRRRGRVDDGNPRSCEQRDPLALRINPASEYNMEDFHKSGGIPQVMKEISPLLNLDNRTVSGKTLEKI